MYTTAGVLSITTSAYKRNDEYFQYFLSSRFVIAAHGTRNSWGVTSDLLYSRWSTSPMDARNLREVTGALQTSWEGIGYLMEEIGLLEEGKGECATGTLTHWMKRNNGSF
ncbi:hypothetical protein EVAR_44364_1 [Eumeta japonica]|uniref:Uncharacterized protein n=1 Tax=Eumeta variegata TaxID=151549 RepID=A0A4C1X9U4_EUMVA|nr:hypothetical protein EVAR_44364_1 [Eumeta japonica]